jgi:hypothetical protein
MRPYPHIIAQGFAAAIAAGLIYLILDAPVIAVLVALLLVAL